LNKRFVNIARNLRKSCTEAEKHLWRYLRGKQLEGFKFRRQEPIGKYIVDFVNFERKIVIELDGGQHATEKVEDEERDKWLKGQGFEILRFWDNEVFKNIEGILEVIRRRLLLPPHPDPLPPSGEEKEKNLTLPV